MEELSRAVHDMRVAIRDDVLGSNAVMASSGYIDTTHGGVMNVGYSLALVRAKARQDREKAVERERERARKDLRAARAAYKLAAELETLKHKQTLRRT